MAAACGDSPTDTTPVPQALALTTQPSGSAQSGVAFTQQPVVQLRRAGGKNVSQSGVTVTAGIATGSGTLSGTTSVLTNGNGQAVYTNLVITGSGPHTLAFTSPGLTEGTSTPIIITPRPASTIVITTQPADTARSAVALARQPAVRLRDATGANVSQSGVLITATIASGSGTLSGTTGVHTDASGQAVYTDLAITGAATHTLAFTSTGLAPATSSGITLPTLLQDGVTVPSLSSAQGGSRWYVIAVPSGVPQLVVSTTGGTGDADLYVRFDALPDSSAGQFDCHGTTPTTIEQCAIVNPAAGSWYILVLGYGAYSGVNLIATTTASCTLTTPGDADGDRLPDCVETNTQVFVSALDTGTDPNNADTDRDGIADGDETLGTLQGLALPNMGVNPLRRDILVEYDWFDDALECGPHSHRTTAAALAMVQAAFAAAPLVNPDGSNGINLIQDYGQGGVFTGGNFIPDADGVLAGGVGDPEFAAYKGGNFSPNRNGYFHYTILPHRYNTSSNSSGQAELPGDDLIVSLYCAGSDANVAGTIMHELGHNLILRHGGAEDTNWKPNYNSVMNYKYQFAGIDNNCTPPGNGVLDYSTGTRPALNESNLDETMGVCGSPPGWDWNGDGDDLDVGFAADINIDAGTRQGDGVLATLTDYNDWAFLYLGGLSDADGASLTAREIVSCTSQAPLTQR